MGRTADADAMIVEEIPEVVGFVEQAVAVPLKEDRKRRKVGGRSRVRVNSADEEEEEDERATEDRRTDEGRRGLPADDERCSPAGRGPHLGEKGWLAS